MVVKGNIEEIKNILHHASIISHISVLGLLEMVIMLQQRIKIFQIRGYDFADL